MQVHAKVLKIFQIILSWGFFFVEKALVADDLILKSNLDINRFVFIKSSKYSQINNLYLHFFNTYKFLLHVLKIIKTVKRINIHTRIYFYDDIEVATQIDE